MPREPRCSRCGSNTRIVAYRRNNDAPSWTCASCAGCSSDTYRGFAAMREVEPPDAILRPSPRPRPERSELSTTETKSKYSGFRAKHDPLRY